MLFAKPYFNESKKAWCAQIELEPHPDGSRNRKLITRKDLKELKAELAKLNPDDFKPIAEKHLRTGEMLDTYFEARCRGEDAVRQNTRTSYRLVIDFFLKPIPVNPEGIRLGDVFVAELKPRHIEFALDALKTGNYTLPPHTEGRKAGQPREVKPKSSGTRLMAWLLLKAALRHAKVPDAKNPILETARPRVVEKKLKCFNLKQVQQFYKEVEGDNMETLFKLLVETGGRVGEILALQETDVDLEVGTVTFRHTLLRGTKTLGPTKTVSGDSRVIHLTPTLIAAIKRQHERKRRWGLISPWLFPTKKGEPLDESNVGRSLDRICHRSGLPRIRVHDLRHSAATMMISVGLSERLVYQRLGHADAKMMKRYVHAMSEHEQLVAQRLATVFEGAR